MTPKINVLPVDDDPGFAELTADFLDRFDGGFLVDSCHDATTALEHLESDRPDCIVSDYEMPEIDGLEFLREVRNHYPNLPFILFTGKGTETVASEAISADVTDYLQKGGGVDNFELLANQIENAVRSHRASAEVRRFQRLSKAFPDVIFHIDEGGRYLNVLAGESNLARFDTAEDLIGKRFQDFLPAEQAAEFRQAIDQAITSGETQRIEYGFDDASGYRWLEGRIVPLSEMTTDQSGVLWAARDITERKEAEKTRHKYQSLVDGLLDPVCIYDEDGCYELVSQHLADEYGVSKDELVGKPSKLVEQIKRVEDGDPFQELIDGDREEFMGEYDSNLPGREKMECRLTRFIHEGECEGVALVSRDITERRRRERELQRTNARLEDFAKIISHDLRNPLSVADGRIQLAQAECDNQHLKDAAAALDRMETMIDDVLELASEEPNVSEVESVDLAELSSTCWSNAATGELELVTDSTRHILANPSRLKQLLENLFRNALEHGGDAERVGIGGMPDGFYVEDDGVGIPEERRQRVFDSGYSTNDEGTGLGLNIVAQIAEAHEWNIEVSEAEGGGARFEFTDVQSPGNAPTDSTRQQAS